MAYEELYQGKVGGLPGMRDMANRVKYPEAYSPGTPNQTTGFDRNPGSRLPVIKPTAVLVDGPYNNVPPRSTIDAGKNLIRPVATGMQPASDRVLNINDPSLGNQRVFGSQVDRPGNTSGFRVQGQGLQTTAQPGTGWTSVDPANAYSSSRALVPGSPVTSNTGPQSSFTADDLARAKAYQQRTKFNPSAAEPAAEYAPKTSGLLQRASDVIDNMGGQMATATGLASQVLQNPAIANQTNEVLAKRGMKGIIATKDQQGFTNGGDWSWKSGESSGAVDQQPRSNYKPTLNDMGIDAQQKGVLNDGWNLKPGQINPNAQTPNQAQSPNQKSDSLNDYINKQMLVENNAMSRGPAGLTRYTQGPNGELLRQGSGGEISTLSGPPVRNRQSPAAEAAGTTDAWYNNGYTGGVAQYRKEKEQQAIYQNMDGLMADAMNPNLSQEARANAQKMFTALAGRVSDLDSQYTQSQGQQIQGRNQQAQLGLQERQYNDQAPEREFSANVVRKKNEVLQGDNGFEKLGLSQRDKDRYKAFTLDKNDPQTGVKQGESAAVIDTYTGKVNGGGQQKANLQALQALYQNPDKIDEFENKFGYRPEGF